ncbi:MAG: lytic transglycosylase domain-containing protein [Pseudomonadota bacterium]
MNLFRRAILAPISVLAAAACLMAALPAAAQSERPTALSASDRLSYTTAFDALRRGDLDAARDAARQAQDRVLMGQVEFERMFHADYSATYDELAAWLEEYSDLPDAPRVYNLALRRRPDGATEPKRPAGVSGRAWSLTVSPGGGADPNDPAKAARIAFNNDDLSGAYAMGRQIGDWWTAGLAAWRLNQFNDAYDAFRRVAEDPTQDAWTRAGAAVWTARSAGASGRQDQVQGWLRLATRWPATFYGQVAGRMLGEEAPIEGLGPRPYATPGVRQVAFRPDEEPGVDRDELNAFVRDDPRARRAVAYYEVGRRDEYEGELRAGIRTAVTDGARRLWTGLAKAMGFQGGRADRQVERIDAADYPMPDLQPEGGFVVERSLVLAIARKETNFNATARSGVGAYGMMQVMPTTATELTGDRTFTREPRRLFDPAVNVRIGQAYVTRMLNLPQFQGDLLRTAASYNAGPGPMLAALRKLGPNPDPLLLIETIDVPQARDYVEKVVAAYWIYQRLTGRPLNTLDAVAAGAGHIPISLDYVPPPPADVMPVQTAETSSGS